MSILKINDRKNGKWIEIPTFKGDKGDSSSIKVGTTTTGKEAKVTNSGTETNAVLDFVIPKQNSKETVEGSKINLKDANGSYSPITFKIEGKSEQKETLSSSTPIEIKSIKGICNLFDKNNANLLNCYVNDNGIIDLASASSVYIPITGGETYTIQRKGSKRLRAITTSSLPSNGVPKIDIINDDDSDSITITTSTTAKYLVVYFYLNSDSNDKTIYETLSTLQIETGNKKHPYVPYGNWLQVKNTGSNLFNINNSYMTGSFNGTNAVVTKNTLDKFEIDTNSIKIKDSRTFQGYISDFCQINETSYTLTFKSTNNNIFVAIAYYDEEKEFISKQQLYNSSERSLILVVPQNAKYIRYIFETGTITNTEITISDIMLKESVESVEYEPYQEQSLFIDMNKPNLLNTPYTSENKLTDTATKSDYYKSLSYYAKLEKGKKYRFSCKTDGTWGHSTAEDTVETYLLLNNEYTTLIYMSTNPFIFTPTVSGNYYIRYDINSSGKTHSFWDFEIVEVDTCYELASVNNIKDTLIIQNDKAIIDKKIGKINDYNGESITTEYISTTGDLSTGATIYYVLPEPQTIVLDNLYNLNLFDNENNLTTNDELQPNMLIEYWTDLKGNRGADGSGVKVLSGEDASNPICLFDLEDGIYSLFGYVKYYPTYEGKFVLSNSTLATVQKNDKTTYIQLLQPYTSKIIGYEITSNSYKSTEIEPIEDTEWLEATLTSDFQKYNNLSENVPKYRKVGKIVEIRGVVAPTSELAAGASKTIFTLPIGYRPSIGVSRLQQGSGKKSWLCRIETNGIVNFQRYGITTTEKCPTTDWLPFQMEFMVD